MLKMTCPKLRAQDRKIKYHYYIYTLCIVLQKINTQNGKRTLPLPIQEISILNSSFSFGIEVANEPIVLINE